jgi:hypothetical protein
MPYFSAVAGVTGAIFALVFVAMQVRLDAWIGNHLRSYAVVFTLNELAAPLFLSLISLMPHHPWQVGARIVAAIGLLIVLGQLLTYAMVQRRNEPVSRIDHFRVVVGSAVSATVFASLIFASFFHAVTWIAGVCLWQVMSGITQALVLLAGWRGPAEPVED